MQRYLATAIVIAVLSAPGAAQEAAPSDCVRVQHVNDVVTVYSVGRAPCEKASHTYILTHGMGGVDDRFYALGQAIHAQDADANILVVDWSAGANRTIARIPNLLATADRIDLTGDLLGSCLTKLAKKKCFDPAQATFIGESFGNCVNHRAALVLRKNGLPKANRALVLNPAPASSSYPTPLFTVPFKQSIAYVSDSWLDSRQVITNKKVLLKPTGKGPIEQHTYGMHWLQEHLHAGETIASLFPTAAQRPAVAVK
jgi:hypothetical protein